MSIHQRMKLSVIELVAVVLVAVGAINWGLVGVGAVIDANLNLVEALLGSVAVAETAVYLLVGLAGLYLVVMGIQRFRTTPTPRGEPKPA